MDGPQDLANAPGWEDVGRLIGSKISRIEELERENVLLRSQLEAQLLEQTTSKLSETRSATDYVPRGDYDKLVLKYNELHKRYRDLHRKYSRSEQSMQRAYEKYKHVKVRIREWQVYLEKHGLPRRATRTSHDEPGDQIDGESANAHPDRPLAGDLLGHGCATAPQIEASIGGTPGNDGSSHLPTSECDPLGLDVLPAHILPQLTSSESSRTACAPTPSSPSKRISSSQTTCVDDKPTSPPPTSVRVESDTEPQIVWARSAKRKRGGLSPNMPPPPVRIKQEPTSSAHPVELVSNDYSSPPPIRQDLLRKQTSDLDALVEHTNTPRKRRHQILNAQRAASEHIDRDAALLPRPQMSRHSLPLCDSEQTNIKVELDVGQGEQDAQRRSLPKSHGTAPIPAKDATPASSTVLRPLSPNVAAMSRVPRAERRGDSSRRPRDSMSRVSLVAEDGIDHTSEVQATPHHDGTKIIAHHRLDALLNEPSPDRAPLPICPTPATGPLTRIAREAKASAKTSPKTPAPPRPPASNPPTRASNPRLRPPTPPRPEEEPLRARELAALGLDDFRINAAYLGADFAFTDTLRGREQRRCLPGCTRPECCGEAFRRAVELGAVRPLRSDADALEAFLGPQWEALLGACGPARRREMLVQAHAFDAARVHGRHRTAFERPRTPPGFWRTDMPTTQEEREDREKARAMERQKVEERWREAMRENGRWRFRDE